MERIFRGKAANGSGRWVYGSLIEAENFCCILERADKELLYSGIYPYLDGELGLIDGYVTPVIPETVGMYVQLSDKSEQKIFEGDIVEIFDHDNTVNGKYVVIYDEINHCYALQRSVKYHFSYFSFSDLNGFNKSSLAIGNIHDNPEFLELMKEEDYEC